MDDDVDDAAWAEVSYRQTCAALQLDPWPRLPPPIDWFAEVQRRDQRERLDRE